MVLRGLELMKKNKKILIIVLGVLIGVVLIDSFQAKVFNNKPILRLTKDVNGGYLNKKNIGVLVDNYVCNDGEVKTVFKWEKYSCIKEEEKYVRIDKKSDVTITDKMVSLKIKEGTLFDSSVSYILENNSKKEVNISDSVWLEKEQDGKWYTLKVKKSNKEFEMNLLLLGLVPGAQTEQSMTFHTYGKLTPGKYRIVKRMSFLLENDSRDNFYVADEFIID